MISKINQNVKLKLRDRWTGFGGGARGGPHGGRHLQSHSRLMLCPNKQRPPYEARNQPGFLSQQVDNPGARLQAGTAESLAAFWASWDCMTVSGGRRCEEQRERCVWLLKLDVLPGWTESCVEAFHT